MTNEQIWLSVLIALLANIVTGFATYYFTAKRDASVHERETKRRNAEVAEIAINHLQSSYLASKRLRIDVLSHLATVRKQEPSGEAFGYILDGISRSIEQNRISILSNILDWKHHWEAGSETLAEMNTLKRAELSTVAMVAAEPLYPPVVVKADRGAQVPVGGTSEPGAELLKSFRKPDQSSAETIMRAIVEGDAAKLRVIARERLDALAPVQQIIAPAAALCKAEDPVGIEILKALWTSRRAELKADNVQTMLSGVVAYHERTDTETEGLGLVQELGTAYQGFADVKNEDMAYVMNQIGKVHGGSPSNRSRLMRWATLVLASTIRGRWASFMPGSGRMRTAWTTSSGCAGRPASRARDVATVGAGGWATAIAVDSTPWQTSKYRLKPSTIVSG